jgi:peptide/nickel transport system permease protein
VNEVRRTVSTIDDVSVAGDREIDAAVKPTSGDRARDGVSASARRRHPVARLLLARLMWAIPTLLIVSFTIFLLVDLAPGDAAAHVGGENATPEQIEAIREDLGLNDPLFVRYGDWLMNAVKGDLGTSVTTREEVTTMIGRALPLTMSIVVVTLAATVVLAGALGIAAALRPNGLLDQSISFFLAVAISVPGLFLCLLLVSELAVKRDLLPALGYVPLRDDPVEWLKHLVIPAATLASVTVGEVARQLRTSLVEVLHSDYIVAAHAKGLSRGSIVLKHGLKNAAIPVLTVIGARFSLMIGGTVIVENIVVIRGIGFTLTKAVLNRDVTAVTGIVVVTTVLVLAMNLLVDLLYGVLNPKLRVT